MKSSLSRFLFTIVFLSLSSCNIDEIPPEVVSDVRGWFTIESNNIGVNLAWSEVSDDDIEKYIIFKSTDNSIPQEIGETQSNYFTLGLSVTGIIIIIFLIVSQTKNLK
mgnify:CR=1 FL=1